LISALLLSLAIILPAAKVAGHLASRLKQPPVLGELLAGALIGNLPLIGFSALDFLKTDPGVELLAQLGVVLLLFRVGLPTTIRDMRKVGLSAVLTALLGTTGSFLFGWGMAVWLLPSARSYTHLFIGASLMATSVGITARVLTELGQTRTTEARIVLGAAIVDDVLGLVALASMTALVGAVESGGRVSLGAASAVVLKAGGFLVGSLVLGFYLTPHLFTVASRLQASGVLLAVGLAFCFLFAWLAGLFGLAPLVGAFAAGLVLEDLHFRDFVHRGERMLDELVEPIGSFLVPVFFVVMGARTDVRVLASPGAIGLAAALTLAAIVGKQLCALGPIGPAIDRLSIGIGMVPRGEVQLIFAGVGASTAIAGGPLLDQTMFSAIVVVVMVTTVITPPALMWSLSRRYKRSSKARATPPK